MIWLKLDGRGPRFGQLYRALRGAVLTGTLAPGAKIPSTRALASELGLSRTTVLLAYDQLAAEGYLAGRRGSGSYVRESPAAAPPRAAPVAPTRLTSPPSASIASTAPERRAAAMPPRLSRRVAELTTPRARPLLSSYVSERPRLQYDFRYGAPAVSDLPLGAWHRCLGRRARRAPARAYDYGHPQGAPALRKALADYLLRSRGVACTPDQMMIVTGSQQAIDLAARALLDPRDAVVIEDPCFEGARHALELAGARLVLGPVDGEGLDPAVLRRDGRHARLVYVTPSHQYPLGGVMPYPRRVELLAWAARAGSWVIEDDYDSEFRYEGRPLEALKSLDEDERVIYVGTFSKVMFPALRVGYVILPPALVEAFLRVKALADGGSPALEQNALADFLAEGHFERHLRRSRRRNGARRAALLAALDAELGDAVEVAGANAGLHVVVWLRNRSPRTLAALAREAAAVGVGIYPVTPHYASPPARAGLLIGYSGLSERDIRAGVARLARLLA